MSHIYDKRHLSFTAGQQVRCLCCETLQTPRAATSLQGLEYDRVPFCRALAEKAGIYFCPACHEFDTDPRNHANNSPACVAKAQVAHA